MTSTSTQPRRRARRIAFGMLLLLLATDLALSLLLRGPIARALLENALLPALLRGSPVQVRLGHIELRPLPPGGLILGTLLTRFASGPRAPYIAVRDAEILLPGIRIEATADAELSLGPLLRGIPRLRQGAIDMLDLTLDQDRPNTQRPDTDRSDAHTALSMLFDALQAAQIPVRRLVLRDTQRLLLEASGDIGGTPDGLRLHASFSLPAAAAENGTLDLVVTPQGPHWAVSGAIAAEKIDLTRLAGQPDTGGMVMDAQARLSGAYPAELRIALNGTMRSTYGQAISGDFSAKAWWRPDEIIVNDLLFNAPALETQADAVWSTDEGIVIEARHVLLKPEAIRMLGALAANAHGRLDADDTAALEISNLLAGFGGDAGYRIARGDARFTGIQWKDNADTPLLSSLHGSASVAGDAFQIHELRAEGLRITGNILPQADGALRIALSGECDLPKARLPASLLPQGLQLDSGTLTLDHLAALLQPDADLQEVDAAITLAKVSGTLRPAHDRKPLPWRDLSGRIRYAHHTLSLERLRAEGIALDGSLRREGAAWRFDLVGNADLAGGLARLAIAGLPLASTKGQLHLTRCRGTHAGGATLPTDLELEGTWKNGAADLHLGDTGDSLSGIHAAFRSTPQELSLEMALNAQKLGPLAWKGRYLPQKNTITGILQADLAHAAQHWFSGATGTAYPRAALAAFGPADYLIEADLKPKEAAIRLHRDAPPALSATAQLDTAQGALRAAEAQTTLRIEDISAILPGGANGHGPAPLTLRMDGAPPRFTLDVLLDEAEINIGQYITKRAGQAAALRVEGAAAPQWRPETLTLSVLGQVIPLRFDNAAVACDTLDLRLAPLAALLPEGASASGRLHGRFHAAPPMLDLYFDNAGLSFAQGLGMDRMDGRVRYQNNALTIENMRLQGANSDCTIEAGVQDGKWEARASGNKLDLMAVLALWNAALALQHSGDPEATPPGTAAAAAPSALRGRAAVAISEVYLRRAVLREVQTDILLNPEEILFDKLRMRVGEGTAAGALRIQRGGSGRAAATLQVTRADMRVMDGLLESPREIFGTMDGSLQLSFTPGAAMMRDMTGKIEYTALNGSYGKAGMGTKILTAFRATELVRLRLPRLRDEGLVFDESHARLNFQNGLMTIERFDALSTSHAILAEGKIDFARDESDLLVQVHLLESVTGVLGKVPLVGQLTEALRSQSGLRFRVTGPIANPQVSAGSPINPVRGVREGGRSAGNALRSIGGLFRPRGGE